jgi:hypothetical protein
MSSAIEVERSPDLWPDRLRKYKVLVDGTVVGSIGPGESLVATVDAGSHEVRAKIDWCGSEGVSVEVGSNETARLSVRSGVRSVFLLPLYLSVRRNRYITVEGS